MIQSCSKLLIKKLVMALTFDLIDNLHRCSILFDVSPVSLSKSEKFNTLATAGGHRNLNCVFISRINCSAKNGCDVEAQTTHIVLIKSPVDVERIDVLVRLKGLGKQLKQLYDDGTQETYGHFMIDFRPSIRNLYRFCSKVTLFLSNFFAPNSIAHNSDINDERAELF